MGKGGDKGKYCTAIKTGKVIFLLLNKIIYVWQRRATINQCSAEYLAIELLKGNVSALFKYYLISNKNWTKSMRPWDKFIFHWMAVFKGELVCQQQFSQLCSCNYICRRFWGFFLGCGVQSVTSHTHRDTYTPVLGHINGS